MKVWGIGTGRCGTATLARTCCGLHEPRPWIFKEAVKYYWGDHSDANVGLLQDKLGYRMRVPHEVIVDLSQSHVIPVIAKLDPDAYFVWLVREPIEAVKSFMGFEYFIRKSGMSPLERLRYGLDTWRTAPKEGWPEHWGWLMKCLWYWNEMNSVILKGLQETGAEFEIILTNELGNRKYNPIELATGYKRVEKIFWTPETKEYYSSIVEPFWKEIVSSRESLGSLPRAQVQ